MKQQQGQTLIETIVAAFILTMGIGAALGLANYSLGVSQNIKQQTIAMGLAREGIEVVKNIRDTNWLKAPLEIDCYNYETGASNAFCYREWMDPTGGQSIDPVGNNQPFIISFDPNLPQPWFIVPNATQYGLTAAPGGGTGSSQLFYSATNPVLASVATSGFARKITILEDSFSPFNRDNSSRLRIVSQVWWSGKKCTMTNDMVIGNKCSITLETYLTNWKNF